MVVEVVSTSWETDYARKVEKYVLCTTLVLKYVKKIEKRRRCIGLSRLHSLIQANFRNARASIIVMNIAIFAAISRNYALCTKNTKINARSTEMRKQTQV